MSMNLSKNIRELRQSCGFTQAELGGRLHKAGSTVRMWELGKSLPDAETIIALARILNVTTDYLLSNTESAAPENSEPIPEPSAKDKQILKISKELNHLNSKQLRLINELIREISCTDKE
jgi:transcriptional regulator with XRE-family HTH domain